MAMEICQICPVSCDLSNSELDLSLGTNPGRQTQMSGPSMTSDHARGGPEGLLASFSTHGFLFESARPFIQRPLLKPDLLYLSLNCPAAHVPYNLSGAADSPCLSGRKSKEVFFSASTKATKSWPLGLWPLSHGSLPVLSDFLFYTALLPTVKSCRPIDSRLSMYYFQAEQAFGLHPSQSLSPL